MGRWLLEKSLSIKDFRPVENGPGRSNVYHQCSTRPVDLEQASLGIRKDPYPVPAPFAGAVAAPDMFRACHHSIPLVMDCTICASETSRTRGLLASGGLQGHLRLPVFRGLHERTSSAQALPAFAPVRAVDPAGPVHADSQVRIQ